MDHGEDLSKICKSFSIQLTPLPNSIINKWRRRTKQFQRRHSRRRGLTAWQKGDCRLLRPKRTLLNDGKRAKYVFNESDDESLQLEKLIENHDSITLNNCLKTDGNNTSMDNEKFKATDITLLPKTDISDNDMPEWKYRRKRRLSSKSSSSEYEMAEEESIQSQSNDINLTIDNKPQVDLNKEVRIVSTRLEDLDDPHVRRWQSNASKKQQQKDSVEPAKNKTASLTKTKPRIPPKSSSLECTVCSAVFESKEELSDHIFKHTARELQDAYRAAKEKQREMDNHGDNDSDGICESDDKVPPASELNQHVNVEYSSSKPTSSYDTKVSSLTNEQIVPITICSCHNEHRDQYDGSVQIEMVLFCETCQVLFRRHECFETHYRFSSKCNEDRTKGRSPKLFCTTCLVILNTLSTMRRHLEEHASINYHGTVNFVCNICRVVFFGVGTVFCTHWFNHDKDPTFVASRYSFPKLCITNQGVRPSGSAPGEQYLYVAEYVCRCCKQQFSSENELSNHVTKECKGVAGAVQVQQRDTVISSPVTPKSNESNPMSTIIQESTNAESAKQLTIVYRWICDFCNGIFPNQVTFEEHSVKHLQDGGYPGYLCVYQPNMPAAYICNVCRAVYSNLQDLNKHWVSHIQIIKFICTVCDEKMPTIDSFQAHIAESCWKLKPDCRVWFSRQQHACKICKTIYKTAEELAHHYVFDHKMEKNSGITENLVIQPKFVVETPSISEISASSRTKEAETSVVIVPEVFESVDEISSSTREDVENVPIVNHMLPANSNSEKFEQFVNKQSPPKQPASSVTAKMVDSVNQNEVIIDPVSLRNITQKQITPKIRALEDPSVQVILSNTIGTNISASLVIDNTVTTMSDRESTFKITRRDTCLHGSEVIAHNTDKSDKDIENPEASGVIVHRPSKLLKSLLLSPGKDKTSRNSNSFNNIAVADNTSKISSDSGSIEIIDENNDDEPEIIEMTSNLKTLPNTPVQTKTWNQPENVSLANNIPKITEGPVTEKETESAVTSTIKRPPINSDSLYNGESGITTEKNDSNVKETQDVKVKANSETPNLECSINTDNTKPHNFLRVKKFQELQAVKNYICEQCSAAFDNMKSLTEHLVAHANSLLGNVNNVPRPTMMAALILPELDSSTVEKSAVVPMSYTDANLMAGKRILPYIPQRVRSVEARKASPLVRGQPTPRPIDSQNNVQQLSQQFSCPVDSVFYSHRVEGFTNYLSNYNNSHVNNNQGITTALRNSTTALQSLDQCYQNAQGIIRRRGDLSVNPLSTVATEIPRDKPKLYTCKLCHFNTFDKQNIFDHVRFDHFPNGQGPANIGIQNQPIQQLDISTPATNGLASNLVYKCTICMNFQYSSFQELTWHIQSAHSITRETPGRFFCIHCPQSENFDSEESLKKHENICHKYTCNICLQRFQSFNELLGHMRYHQSTMRK